jgi:hypothetical protein
MEESIDLFCKILLDVITFLLNFCWSSLNSVKYCLILDRPKYPKYLSFYLAWLKQLSKKQHIYGTVFDQPLWVDLFRRSTKCLGRHYVILMYWVDLMSGRPFVRSTLCRVDLLSLNLDKLSPKVSLNLSWLVEKKRWGGSVAHSTLARVFLAPEQVAA